MVVKTTLPQSGWSYSNGDDQYDNLSIGSTIDTINLEKLARNLKKNNQNSTQKMICINFNGQHTDDQGWTRMDSNSNRKPKAKTNKHPTIDSIISSIDIGFKIKGKTEQQRQILIHPHEKIDAPSQIL
jgi:hypothetical protein